MVIGKVLHPDCSVVVPHISPRGYNDREPRPHSTHIHFLLPTANFTYGKCNYWGTQGEGYKDFFATCYKSTATAKQKVKHKHLT